MSDHTIACPRCAHIFKLNEAISAEMEETLRQKLSEELKKKELELASKNAELLNAEKKRLLEAVQAEQAQKLQDLNTSLESARKKLEASRKQELELLNRQKELQEKEENLKLETARQVESERKKLLEDAKNRFVEEYRLKSADKEKQLVDLKKQIEELQRKTQNHSQEFQGTVQEIEIATILEKQFPSDRILRVAKGKSGGDLLLTVFSQDRVCGKILFESKRTKNWSNDWIEKLKTDMQKDSCEIGIIVSQTLPSGVKAAEFIDGVWVCDFATFPVLTAAVRSGMIELAKMRSALDGQDTSAGLLYKYVASPQFQKKIVSVLERIVSMQENLEKEKRSTMKSWSVREKEIHVVIETMASMYGDLQGVMRSSLPDIEILSLPAGA